MKGNDALNNFKNVREYILLLPIHEQIREIDRMIKCHTEYNHPRVQVKEKYALIHQLKDFKELLVQYYLQQICDDPSIAKTMPPLHEILCEH